MQVDPTATLSGKADTAAGEMSDDDAQSLHRGEWRQHVHKESARNTGSPHGVVRDDQPDARVEDGPETSPGVAERFVVHR